MFSFSNWFSNISLPKDICSSIFLDLINLLSWDFTLLVTANLSHKREGWDWSDVSISTWSPLFKIVFKGCNLPLIFAATHLSPISECIEYAKSIVVEFLGNSITSPFGLKT